MKFTKYTVALAAFVTAAVTVQAREMTPFMTAMDRNVDASNVLVDAGCSGTIVAPKVVLTAAHCVVDRFRDVKHDTIDANGKVVVETIRVAVPGTVTQFDHAKAMVTRTTSVNYKITAIDREADMAVLELAADMGVSTEIACQAPVRGDTVYAVGNPFGVLYASLSMGIVGSTDRSYRDLLLAGQLSDATDMGEHALLQHTSLIAPGNSGGALYNAKGQLVGVNVRGGSGFAFAVTLADVRLFLGAVAFPSCP